MPLGWGVSIPNRGFQYGELDWLWLWLWRWRWLWLWLNKIRTLLIARQVDEIKNSSTTHLENYMKFEVGTKVLVRGDRSGVFIGEFQSLEGTQVFLHNCRRLWRWYGAQCCSDLAMSGTITPEKCQFPEPTREHLVLDALEVIPMSSSAWDSLQGVPVWRA
jgi:hypothetical protein